jgi:hypothetical protein
LRAEVNRLRQAQQTAARQHAADSATITSLRGQVQHLETENCALRAQLEPLQALASDLQQQLTALQQQMTTVQEQLAAARLPPPATAPAPPAWAKPNTPARPKGPRRKRAPHHNHGRRRLPPTRIADHRFTECPECAAPLQDHRLLHERQVLEIPPPPAVEVINHQVWRGWCAHCRAWRAPPLDLRDQVVGQSRFGVRLVSLLVTLRYQARLPIRVLQGLLADLWGVELSSGGIVGLLKQVKEATQPAFDALLAQARASPVLHMDETGWRENGDNGYVWELATDGPTGVRVYVYDPSRGGAVLSKLLAGEFAGVLVSDFYAGYNGYTGVHQRCWVHLLRDLHDLKKAHPAEQSVQKWASAVKQLYLDGQRWLREQEQPTAEQRAGEYVALRARAAQLGQQYARAGEHPCHALAQRLLRHLDELFQFVRLAGVPADNNLGERGIRPLVVGRKISGGSRSEAGSETHMNLASLVGTWLARGQKPFQELLHWLCQPPPSEAAPA